jgi:hypothetical protein
MRLYVSQIHNYGVIIGIHSLFYQIFYSYLSIEVDGGVYGLPRYSFVIYKICEKVGS